MTSTSAAWRRYAAYFDLHAGAVIFVLAAALLRASLTAGLAIVLWRIVNSAMGAATPGGIFLYGLFAAALALCASAVALAIRKTALGLSKNLIARLRAELHEKLHLQPADHVAKKGRAALHTIIVHDTERVDAMTNGVIGVILPAGITLLALAAVLAWIAPLFGLACLAIGCLFWVGARFTDPGQAARNEAFRNAFEAYSRGSLLGIERLDLARASAAEQAEMKQRKQEIETLRRASTDMVWRSVRVSEIRNFLGLLATMLLLVFGGVAATSGFAAWPNVLTVYLVLMMMRTQAGVISFQLPELHGGKSSLSRIWQMLDAEDETPYRGSRRIAFGGRIKLERVAFGYDGKAVLKGIDLELIPGRCVAIYGANGAGKTTLARLIMGYYRPQQGSIFADGVSYDELDIAQLRRGIGFVPQLPVIFSGSVAENIAYGLTPSPLEIERVAGLSGASSFISRLREGYATQLGDGGLLLSGGERQHIALARALLRHPRLLVLDEPTSHLDPACAENFLALLAGMKDGPAILMISHSAEAAAMADDVAELKDGRLTMRRGGRPILRAAR